MPSKPPGSLRVMVTLTVVAAAALLSVWLYRRYVTDPWTRDGRVQADVVRVASRVDGPVVKLPIVDNQEVAAGDTLFEIDPRTFDAAVQQAQARLAEAQSKMLEAKDQADRVREVRKQDAGAIAMEEVVAKEALEKLAQAAVDSAKSALTTAQLELGFTKVTSPVDGYLTYLTLDIGTQAVADEPVLALVDKTSFWISAFFRETVIDSIHPGDDALVTLMTYPDRTLTGKVHSVGWGISRPDGLPGFDLLPAVEPNFEWIRLAQRIPVRIELDPLPEGVLLRVGMTASVQVKGG